MKRGLLLVLGMMSIISAQANAIDTTNEKIEIVNRYNDAVTFIERGVEFHVFLNGDFDFNSSYRNNRYYDYNGRRSVRKPVLRIKRDYRGRITRVGNTNIRYDYKGNVKKIGNIRMYYQRGLLKRVGNLKISYNKWGDPYFYGEVKYNNDYYDNGFNFNIGISFGDICDFNDPYFYRRDFRNNYRKFKEDRNFYYYKSKSNAKVGKRSSVIKRRKQTSTTTRRNSTYKKREVTPRKRTTTKKTPSKRRVVKKYEKKSRRS